MMNWYHDGTGSFTPFVWVLMVLLWVGLIALIVFLVVRLLPSADRGRPRSAPGPGPGPGPVESPEQILDRLFALGEIDEQTYRSRRAALADVRRTP